MSYPEPNEPNHTRQPLNRSDEAYKLYGPRTTDAGVHPPVASDLTAAFDAARKRVEAQQPTEKELKATEVRCHLAEAMTSLYSALWACQDKGLVEGILAAMAEVKSVQIDELRLSQRNCESGSITT